MTRFAILTVLVALVAPASASAQASSPTDPGTDSPSGTVYELPLDDARKDAAPRQRARKKAADETTSTGGGSATGGNAATGPPPSAIRSENNFGSSARVPGVDTAATTRSKQGSTGSGGSTADTKAAGLSPVSADTDGDGPSWGVIGPLLALLVLVGVTAGSLASRARRS